MLLFDSTSLIIVGTKNKGASKILITFVGRVSRPDESPCPSSVP
jgi:hypothetical protein